MQINPPVHPVMAVDRNQLNNEQTCEVSHGTRIREI